MDKRGSSSGCIKEVPQYIPAITEENKKGFNHDIQCPYQDSNQIAPKHKQSVSSEQQCLNFKPQDMSKNKQRNNVIMAVHERMQQNNFLTKV